MNKIFTAKFLDVSFSWYLYTDAYPPLPIYLIMVNLSWNSSILISLWPSTDKEEALYLSLLIAISHTISFFNKLSLKEFFDIFFDFLPFEKRKTPNKIINDKSITSITINDKIFSLFSDDLSISDCLKFGYLYKPFYVHKKATNSFDLFKTTMLFNLFFSWHD